MPPVSSAAIGTASIFFALGGHRFDNNIRIYNFPNRGGWYDFGFFLGIGSLGPPRVCESQQRR